MAVPLLLSAGYGCATAADLLEIQFGSMKLERLAKDRQRPAKVCQWQ